MKESNHIILPQIHSNYCKFLDTCINLLYFTSLKRLQKEKIKEIESEILKIKQYKNYAISQKVENEANQLFQMQCILNAVKSILSLWIEVKDSNFGKAWNLLIDDYEGIRFIEALLISIENSIFPSFSYLSRSCITTIGNCSICKDDFNLCNHIENEIYMGKLCQRTDKKIIECDHLAIVENPKDRRCIITEYSDKDGNIIDKFTGRISGKKDNNFQGIHAKGSVVTLYSLDFN
jgi:hypothetical protein